MRIVRACVRFSETINIELFSESQPSVALKERERKRESDWRKKAREFVECVCCKACAIIETIDGCVFKGA